MTDTPRQYTAEEIREMFLDHIDNSIHVWEHQPDKTVRERLRGLAFSICVLLDGMTDLPGFIVAPLPGPDAKEFHRGEGENWFPENHDVDGIQADISGFLNDRFLHDRFCERHK